MREIADRLAAISRNEQVARGHMLDDTATA